jgi:hypothetical protein
VSHLRRGAVMSAYITVYDVPLNFRQAMKLELIRDMLEHGGSITGRKGYYNYFINRGWMIEIKGLKYNTVEFEFTDKGMWYYREFRKLYAEMQADVVLYYKVHG